MSLFQHEEINGNGICPTYLHRWILFSGFGRKVYLHKFVGDDWALDPHDHPKDFISIGLRGSYDEYVWVNSFRGFSKTKWTAPWFRRFPASHRHRIETEDGPCWTLVIVGRKKRDWGFWMGSQWIRWDQYVKNHGRERRAC